MAPARAGKGSWAEETPLWIYDRCNVNLAVSINADDIVGSANCLRYHGPDPPTSELHPPPKRDKTVMGAW
jgi:hypothetical protein